MDMASAMGIELLTEAQYLKLQTLGEFLCGIDAGGETPPQRSGARRTSHEWGSYQLKEGDGEVPLLCVGSVNSRLGLW